jgi:hypothetical protein
LDYIEKNYPVSQKDIEEYSDSGLSNSKIHDLLYALSHPDLNILRFSIVDNKKYYWPFEKGDIEILGKWDRILKETPYTKDDHDRYLAATAKRRKEGNESLTDEELFSENKRVAASRRNLIHKEFKTKFDWDTYLKENPYTPDDQKRYNSAIKKKRIEGSESLTPDELFSENKRVAASRRNLIHKEFKKRFKKDI